MKPLISGNKVLYQDHVWSIEQYTNPHTGKQNIVVVSDDVCCVDYVVLYDNGTLGFDYEERIPERIKQLVRELYPQIRK